MWEELDIYLGDTLVGTLRSRDEHNEFRLSSTYKVMYPQPVLGQVFLDDPEHVHKSTVQLPPFFANLLPEGKLREIVARHIGVKAVREFYLLAHLGEDLPGAVRAVATSDLTKGIDATPNHEPLPRDMLKYSLAGVQLKLSMVMSEDKLTLPMRGQLGDWIVKLPNARYPHAPEIELATLTWARAAGIEVPECMLVERARLKGLPKDFDPRGQPSFAIRRFDRPAGGGRVHQEDFAQIFDLNPMSLEKYTKYNYGSIAAVILRVAGAEDFERFLDRLVFVVLSGNGDAHHKNWSLQYPDGVHARLAPAYDQVATILLLSEQTLGLKLSGSDQFQDVSVTSFRKLAEKVARTTQGGCDPARVVKRVKDATERIRAAWDAVRNDVPLAKDEIDTIEAHIQTIPLVSGPRSGFRPSRRGR